MEKTLHLISNAHLDPVWQWEWEEGAAAAVSTFRCAARFCREFDNYVFCHNESLIYRWVEEYEPPLFREIQELVRLGKWHIMGGWHVQPDCNMPSGEAFARQITEGRRYFKEKFGVEPTTAINFDPFGHTRGLVQLLAKSGYDSYMFCRPGQSECPLPAETFEWVGYDGSSVIGTRSAGGYGTGLGHALDKIRGTMPGVTDENPLGFCLWGVGDHGGGPSRQDIAAINQFIDEAREQGVTVLHSTTEDWFAAVRARVAETGQPLPRHEGDLNSWAPGCYTSQVQVKQKYRAVENALFKAEKIAVHAEALGLMAYPAAELGEALYDMLTVQFHDMLPGSSIQPAEQMIMRMLDHALELLSRVETRAFFALTAGQKEAVQGEIPVLAYNPHPYSVEGDFMCEFMLADQNWSGSFMLPVAYQDGKKLPSQCEKEYSNIPLDWRKRVVFHATLPPMSMSRFDCKIVALDKKPVPGLDVDAGQDPEVLRFTTPRMTVEIGRRNGLIRRWLVGGADYLGAGAGAVDVMKDVDDSWGMTMQAWREKIGTFALLSDEEGTRFSDLDAPASSVRIIEDGDVRTVVEAVFGYEGSNVVVRYLISKTMPALDLEVRVINQTKRKLLKLRLPQALPDASAAMEVAFGEEPMTDWGKEHVGHKYLTVTGSDGRRLTVLNRGTYGASFDNGSVYLTLLHSPGYTAHPLGPDRHVMPLDRHSEHMEQGERLYAFRLIAGKVSDVDAARAALAYNEMPTVLNFFPSGEDAMSPSPAEIPLVMLSDSPVVMTALKRTEDGQDVLIRLFNPTAADAVCKVSSPALCLYETLSFGKYEIRTFRVKAGRLIPCRIDEE